MLIIHSSCDSRGHTLEGHARLGEGPTPQFRLGSERDGGSSQNGALNNASGPKGGGTVESSRFGSASLDDIGVCTGNQGTAAMKR
jgi:hypothetical protein